MPSPGGSYRDGIYSGDHAVNATDRRGRGRRARAGRHPGGDPRRGRAGVRCPRLPGDINRASRFQSPFNHPSVVYRRSAVESAGGYEDLPLMEDYWLFARMIAAGARAQNVEEPLVRYRVGAGCSPRRRGRHVVPDWPAAACEGGVPRPGL